MAVRVAIVPTEAHASIHNPNNISFLEHIAKNVGIRAARGEYILVTNPYLYNNKEKEKKHIPKNVGIRAARGEYILVTNPYLYNI